MIWHWQQICARTLDWNCSSSDFLDLWVFLNRLSEIYLPPWACHLWAFLQAYFSIGKDFPAIRCFNLGTAAISSAWSATWQDHISDLNLLNAETVDVKPPREWVRTGACSRRRPEIWTIWSQTIENQNQSFVPRRWQLWKPWGRNRCTATSATRPTESTPEKDFAFNNIGKFHQFHIPISSQPHSLISPYPDISGISTCLSASLQSPL